MPHSVQKWAHFTLSHHTLTWHLISLTLHFKTRRIFEYNTISTLAPCTQCTIHLLYPTKNPRIYRHLISRENENLKWQIDYFYASLTLRNIKKKSFELPKKSMEKWVKWNGRIKSLSMRNRTQSLVWLWIELWMLWKIVFWNLICA